MRNRIRFCAATVMLLSASSLLAAEAPRTKPVGFEYAFVDPQVQASFVKETPDQGRFTREYAAELRVCYVQTSGCRWDSLRQSVSVSEASPSKIGPSTASEWADAVDMLMARAVAKLGADGWEYTGGGPRASLWQNTRQIVIWFKRVRSSTGGR